MEKESAILSSVIPLPAASLQKLLAITSIVEYPKGHFLFRQFKTASQRYKELIDKEPCLLQRVQLGHIASYLGVSQVTLSRIRAEIK